MLVSQPTPSTTDQPLPADSMATVVVVGAVTRSTRGSGRVYEEVHRTHRN